MNLILRIYFTYMSIYIYAKGFFIKTKFSSFDIPIIINNYNRLDYLKILIDYLNINGYHNIIILDNDSTYPPLLEYYKECKHRIYKLDKNLGFKALEKCHLYKEIYTNYYVYTDPDIVPVLECPNNFMEYFKSLLDKHPLVQKVGFSLKYNDLPDHYEKRESVIKWEEKYYLKEISKGVYKAPIDTTFALHRPFSRISTNGYYTHLRTTSPYEAHHLPWYENSSQPSVEDIYYKKNATIGGHWTNGVIDKIK